MCRYGMLWLVASAPQNELKVEEVRARPVGRIAEPPGPVGVEIRSRCEYTLLSNAVKAEELLDAPWKMKGDEESTRLRKCTG